MEILFSTGGLNDFCYINSSLKTSVTENILENKKLYEIYDNEFKFGND